MELLNKNVTNSKSFELLQLMIKTLYNKEKNSESIISYDEFKTTMVAFIEKIMYSLLEDTEFCNDKYSCVIKRLPSYRRGSFDLEKNEITINEDVINDIYSGNITSMTTIFHELNHFKSKYDIKLKRINKDLIRSIKERLLREAFQDSFDEMKKGYQNIKDDYYECNYTVFSEEKCAEINAINNLMTFLEMIDINLSEDKLKVLKDRVNNNISQYDNYLRDLRFSFNFNSYFLDFEEAFDIMIKYNPDWLSIPQLNIEYYVDEDGKVKKRNNEELEDRLKTEVDENIKEYIRYLLMPNNNKRLSKSEFTSNNIDVKLGKFYSSSITNKKSRFKR